MSVERVRHILTHLLNMHKVFARFVPRLFTLENKRLRELHSDENLQLFKGDINLFLQRFITMDKLGFITIVPSQKKPQNRGNISPLSAPKRQGGSIRRLWHQCSEIAKVSFSWNSSRKVIPSTGNTMQLRFII